MPEWLRDSLQNTEQLPPETMAVRVIVALLFGFIVAIVYALSRERPSQDANSLPTTLVLLSVLIALVTMVIGNSVARAFGLVGALSIVRFRTVVEDTRDTAFVIFAVVVGMASGAGYMLLAAIGIPVVALAALTMRNANPTGNAGQGMSAILMVRIGLGHDPEALLAAVLDKYLELRRLTATSTARQGAAIELTYQIRLKQTNEAIALVTELNRVEGVQSVELRPA